MAVDVSKLVGYANRTYPNIPGAEQPWFEQEFQAIRNSLNSTQQYLKGGSKRMVTTVAKLPAASANQGVSYMVTDATATTFWSIVAGAGTNVIVVTSDGTNWRIG